MKNQIEFANRSSIFFRASYASNHSIESLSAFQLGLIYQFSSSNFLVPFPLILNCSSTVRSCQLKTIAGTTSSTRDSEPIRVQLSLFNYTTTTTTSVSLLNQMGLYLRQGRYQLSNCTLNDGQDITDPEQIFSIDIQYEKSIGKFID